MTTANSILVAVEDVFSDWVDIDLISDFDELREVVVTEYRSLEDDPARRAYLSSAEFRVLYAEGLAGLFLSDDGAFDFGGFVDCRDSCGDDDAKVAYINLFGDWSEDDFMERYQGEYGSDVDFADSLAESMGMLDSLPENLREYFDMESFASDLMYDYAEDGGHYFASC